MGVYDEDQKDALELLTEFGEQSKLRVMTTVQADPSKPWEAGETVAEHTTAAAWLNFPSGSNLSGGERMFEGTQIQTGDKKVLLPALGLPFPPNVNGKMVRENGSVWKIMAMKGLDPNGQQILYTLLVRM